VRFHSYLYAFCLLLSLGYVGGDSLMMTVVIESDYVSALNVRSDWFWSYEIMILNIMLLKYTMFSIA